MKNYDFKRVALRNPKSGEFLNIDGQFVKDFSPNTCLVKLHKVEDEYILEHDRMPIFLDLKFNWIETEFKSANKYKVRYCNEDYVNYVQIEIDPSQQNNLKDRFQIENNFLELLVENHDDKKPVETFPLGSYQAFSDKELEDIERATAGGDDLAKYYGVNTDDAIQMGLLMDRIGNMSEAEAENAWISAETMSGHIIKYIKYGTAKITIIPQQGLSPMGEKISKEIKEKNKDNPDFKYQVETVYIYRSGDKTTFQNILAYGDSLEVKSVISMMLVKGVNAAARNLVLFGVRRQITSALALGLESSMTQGLWYVRFSSFLASGSGWATIVGGCLNFVAFIIIYYAVSNVLKLIYKPQYLTTEILNFSDKELLISLPYTSNVPEYSGENDIESPYTLSPMVKAGDWIPDEDLGWIKPEDTVVYGMSYVLENDNKWMEGFSMLYKAAVNDQNSNIYAKISIPWSEKNKMGSDINMSGDDFKSIYKKIDTASQKEVKIKKDGAELSMSINGLTGKDNQYRALIKIDKVPVPVAQQVVEKVNNKMLQSVK